MKLTRRGFLFGIFAIPVLITLPAVLAKEVVSKANNETGVVTLRDALKDFKLSLALSDLEMYMALRYHRVKETSGVIQFIIQREVSMIVAKRIMSIVNCTKKKEFDDWYGSKKVCSDELFLTVCGLIADGKVRVA